MTRALPTILMLASFGLATPADAQTLFKERQEQCLRPFNREFMLRSEVKEPWTIPDWSENSGNKTPPESEYVYACNTWALKVGEEVLIFNSGEFNKRLHPVNPYKAREAITRKLKSRGFRLKEEKCDPGAICGINKIMWGVNPRTGERAFVELVGALYVHSFIYKPVKQ